MSANLIHEVLGSDANVERITAAFMADKIDGERYTEETFRAHLEAISEHGENYLGFAENMAAQPSLSTMYGFVVAAGPDGVYGLISSMGQAGLLDKKKVASAAKLPAKAKAERPWFKQVWDELGAAAWEFLCGEYENRREDYAARFPEIADLASLNEVLFVCQKSTLMTGVAEHRVEQTDTDAAVALGFRLDAHSAARNGGWDYKLNDGDGGYTEKYYERQAKKAAKAEEAAAGEDTSDEDSV